MSSPFNQWKDTSEQCSRKHKGVEVSWFLISPFVVSGGIDGIQVEISYACDFVFYIALCIAVR